MLESVINMELNMEIIIKILKIVPLILYKTSPFSEIQCAKIFLKMNIKEREILEILGNQLTIQLREPSLIISILQTHEDSVITCT